VTRTVVALAGLALLAASGSGQQPPVFHIDLDLVNVTVTVRNPCPPGSGHEEPMPLPGRRSK